MSGFGKLVLALPGGQQQEFALQKTAVALGRGVANDIVLRDAKVSRAHARLECSDAGCYLVDLGSTNGTRVNGARVQRAALRPGDVIALGDSVLRFETTPPQVEADVTPMNSQADLEATLAQTGISMTLSDTRSPRLVVHTPARTWEVPLTQDALHIGRHSENDVDLDHASVSRRHARLERQADGFLIRDLKSTNGTWMGEQRIDERVLHDGDTVRIGNAQLVFKCGFDADELTLVDAGAPKAAQPRRPVVIVPGLMGSELWRGNERYWPNVRRMFTEPQLYRLPDDGKFEPRGLVQEVVYVPNLVKQEQYIRLGDYLVEGLGYERGKDLLEFPYDWRQDVRQASRRLAEAIEAWGVAPPIALIAHSLGCLVSRYYVERLGGKSLVGRLILLGGPHAGVPKALTSLARGPDLPFGIMGEQLRGILATFPSMYQILPTYVCAVDQAGKPIDVLNDETWVAEDHRANLRLARDFRRELGTRSSVPCVSIFGYGLKTITRVTVLRDGDGRWKKVDLASEALGDTTIPEISGVMEGSEIHPVQQSHGSLYVDNDVKMRLKLELTKV